MLTITSMGWIGIAFIVLVLIFFIYYAITAEPKPEESQDSPFNDEDDVAYGAFLEVDPLYLYDKGIAQDSTIQVTIPMETTPDGCVRAEIDHLKFIDIPVKKILSAKNFEEDTRAYKEKKKHVNDWSKVPVFVDEAFDARAMSTMPEPVESLKEDGFGNGGKFGGGGASGSWEESKATETNTSSFDTIHQSTYTPAKDSHSYTSHDSDSGSSSYSSDSGSSGGND